MRWGWWKPWRNGMRGDVLTFPPPFSVLSVPVYAPGHTLQHSTLGPCHLWVHITSGPTKALHKHVDTAYDKSMKGGKAFMQSQQSPQQQNKHQPAQDDGQEQPMGNGQLHSSMRRSLKKSVRYGPQEFQPLSSPASFDGWHHSLLGRCVLQATVCALAGHAECAHEDVGGCG
eukprot:222380-Pelagomonas_calceolata.AAC.2